MTAAALDSDLHRPGHRQPTLDGIRLPVFDQRHPGRRRPDLVSELHPQPGRPVPGQRDPGRLQLRQLHQQRRRRRRGSRSTRAGPTTTRVATMIDPTTGLPRLIFGNDQGVWSVLDNNGTFETQIGSSGYSSVSTDQLAGIDRNGNLQITQFYYGAAQPSSAAAQIAGALFYGSAQDNGGPVSDPNILSNGNITWSGPSGDATGVATDQQGVGTAYQYFWPCCGGTDTDFFQYIGPAERRRPRPAGQAGGGYVGRTFGLLQASNGLPTPDPQWPFEAGANFAVNPVNSARRRHQLERRPDLRHHEPGRDLVRHRRPGGLRQPRQLQRRPGLRRARPQRPRRASATSATSSTSAPRPARSTSPRTAAAAAPATTGSTSPPASTARPSSRSSPTRPAAATTPTPSPPTGVFYIANSIPSASNPTPTWVNITGNIHNLAYAIFGQTYDPTTDPNAVKLNQAVSSDLDRGRLAILRSPTIPPTPRTGYSPGALRRRRPDCSGVFQSLDNGKTWTLFPNTTYGAVAQGGNLPHVPSPTLTSSLGNVNANTGMPNLAGPDQAFVFTGTLTSGSASVTGVNNPDGAARRRYHHRHRHPGRDDNPVRQHVDQHHHALGERDGQPAPDPCRRQPHGHRRPRCPAGHDLWPRPVRHQPGAPDRRQHGHGQPRPPRAPGPTPCRS